MLERFTAYGYVGIFAALVATGFGLPVPEELPVLTAGVLVGHADTPQLDENKQPIPLSQDRLRWFIMLPVCIIGVVVGDGVIYGIGRIWGPRLLDNAWVKRRILTPADRAKIEQNFSERGVLILLTARLTPGIRMPVFMMAGILRVPLARFLFADGLYAIPGVTVLFFLAYIFTDQVLEIFQKIEQYRAILVVAILSFLAGMACHRFVWGRAAVTGSHSEVPTIIRPVEMATEAATHVVEKSVHAVENAIEAVTHTKQDKHEPPKPESAMTAVALTVFALGATPDLPAAWHGEWKGSLKVGDDNAVPMTLNIAPAKENRWSWTLKYGDQKARNYELVRTDKGLILDEKNGIEIPMTLRDGVIHSQFEVEGNILTARYELKDKELKYEIVTTGNPKEMAHKVKVFEVKGTQSAVLKK